MPLVSELVVEVESVVVASELVPLPESVLEEVLSALGDVLGVELLLAGSERPPVDPPPVAALEAAAVEDPLAPVPVALPVPE